MKYKNSIIITILLLIPLLAVYSVSAPKVKDPSQFPNYAQIIPQSFADWNEYDAKKSLVIDPNMQANLEKIYTQTFERTFINNSGKFIMLSLSYGPDQRDGMNVHRPEFCYPAQGFEIINSQDEVLNIKQRNIPLRKLETLNGDRKEFVSYWMLMDKQPYIGSFERKLIQLKTALRGETPDGLLFRVSSIGQNASTEYDLQNQFVNALINDIEATKLKFVIGTNSDS